MCGIAGIVAPQPAEPWLARLDAARRTLTHRGPDDHGVQIVEASLWFAGLAHCRLSILDLSPAGHQPMAHPELPLRVVYNGEIYNFRELRRELEKGGMAFRTQSDTEVLLRAYERWGTDCLARFQGIFAFALWDGRDRSLFVARDRLGKKPFWYTLEVDGSLASPTSAAPRFAFASEMRPLLELASPSREVDPDALALYLTYQYVPAPFSILKSVRKLPPAHYGVWKEGRFRTGRYWEPDPRRVRPPADPVEAAERLRQLMKDAVRSRLVSDVPVGSFLSGGIDSTIVTGLMSREDGPAPRTFSIGFAEERFNELPYARIAAQAFGTEHEERVVRPDALAALPRLVDHFGEPFGDASAVPTFYLAELAARRVKVALSGDGGDELFLGYPRYRAVQWAERYDRLPAWLRRGLPTAAAASLFAGGREKSARKQLSRFLARLDLPREERYLHWVSIFAPDELAGVMAAVRPLPEPVRGLLSDAFERARPMPDFTSRAAYADLVTYLPYDILTKVDVASMAHGLEVRCPFLDPAVVDFALALPTAWKLRGGAGKWILKEAFRDLIPAPLRPRPKTGFGVPLGRWFRGELKELLADTLSEESVRRRGWLDPGAAARLVREHLEGKREHSAKLWALLVLELWARRTVE